MLDPLWFQCHSKEKAENCRKGRRVCSSEAEVVTEPKVTVVRRSEVLRQKERRERREKQRRTSSRQEETEVTEDGREERRRERSRRRDRRREQVNKLRAFSESSEEE